MWLVALDEFSRAGDIAEVLDDDEMRRAGRFRHTQLAQRYVAGRAALRVVLGAALGIGPRAIQLERGPLGKPQLAENTALFFNVSHCEGTAAIAITTAGAIGVDVESAARVREPDRLAACFFDVSEAATISRLPPARAAEAFVRCWTVKEAVLKALGVGLTRALHEVVVEADPSVPLRLRRVPAPLRPSDWTLHSAFLPGRLALAIAVKVPYAPGPEVRCLDVMRAAHSCRVTRSPRRRPSRPGR